ncbi:acyl-CoA thioesterase [Mycolicibacterium lacusdiani]|uniref:acyl-CoA thioesterase n=1 Tax=Mycolicibacterium lacusdiani TaxID=2895283 RepID=UPI001F185E8C|nr:acyl-CoA thioesterase [Mycolicibacterium lacusdiani]
MNLVGTAPRPHPARLLAQTYPVHDAIDARYGDMDTNGHLNNLALASLHENCRATLNRTVFPGVYDLSSRRIRIVTASTVVHFVREAHWPARIGTAIGVGRIGRTSYVASTALFVADECVSLCDTVLVTLDDDGPTPIPDEARERLAALGLIAQD